MYRIGDKAKEEELKNNPFKELKSPSPISSLPPSPPMPPTPPPCNCQNCLQKDSETNTIDEDCDCHLCNPRKFCNCEYCQNDHYPNCSCNDCLDMRHTAHSFQPQNVNSKSGKKANQVQRNSVQRNSVNSVQLSKNLINANKHLQATKAIKKSFLRKFLKLIQNNYFKIHEQDSDSIWSASSNSALKPRYSQSNRGIESGFNRHLKVK